MHIYIYIRTHIDTYTYIYTYTYRHMYVYIYTYYVLIVALRLKAGSPGSQHVSTEFRVSTSAFSASSEAKETGSAWPSPCFHDHTPKGSR